MTPLQPSYAHQYPVLSPSNLASEYPGKFKQLLEKIEKATQPSVQGSHFYGVEQKIEQTEHNYRIFALKTEGEQPTFVRVNEDKLANSLMRGVRMHHNDGQWSVIREDKLWAQRLLAADYSTDLLRWLCSQEGVKGVVFSGRDYFVVMEPCDEKVVDQVNRNSWDEGESRDFAIRLCGYLQDYAKNQHPPVLSKSAVYFEPNDKRLLILGAPQCSEQQCAPSGSALVTYGRQLKSFLLEHIFTSDNSPSAQALQALQDPNYTNMLAALNEVVPEEVEYSLLPSVNKPSEDKPSENKPAGRTSTKPDVVKDLFDQAIEGVRCCLQNIENIPPYQSSLETLQNVASSRTDANSFATTLNTTVASVRSSEHRLALLDALAATILISENYPVDGQVQQDLTLTDLQRAHLQAVIKCVNEDLASALPEQIMTFMRESLLAKLPTWDGSHLVSAEHAAKHSDAYQYREKVTQTLPLIHYFSDGRQGNVGANKLITSEMQSWIVNPETVFYSVIQNQVIDISSNQDKTSNFVSNSIFSLRILEHLNDYAQHVIIYGQYTRQASWSGVLGLRTVRGDVNGATATQMEHLTMLQKAAQPALSELEGKSLTKEQVEQLLDCELLRLPIGQYVGYLDTPLTTRSALFGILNQPQNSDVVREVIADYVKGKRRVFSDATK